MPLRAYCPECQADTVIGLLPDRAIRISFLAKWFAARWKDKKPIVRVFNRFMCPVCGSRLRKVRSSHQAGGQGQGG